MTATTSEGPVDLRDIFTDENAVKIYPDDFTDATTGQVEKTIIMEELVDRYNGHFSDQRVAVLFRPGTYHDVNFPVGYWTQVLGLGETPEQVTFDGSLGIYCLPANTDNHNVGSLDTFWRSAENFQSNTKFIQETKSNENNGKWCVPTIDDEEGLIKSLTPDQNGQYPSLYPVGDLSISFPSEAPNFNPLRGMVWAVSQAAPLRRIRVANQGNLHLSLGNNNASGGFIANIDISGYLMLGSQQQYSIRNCDIGRKASGGAWSMVFNGCRSDTSNTESSSNTIDWVGSSPQVVAEPATTTRVEKPFIFIGKDDDKLYLGIPRVKANSAGSNHTPMTPSEKVEIDNVKDVRVFTPLNSYHQVQEAADNGAHIILSPGTYNWDKTLGISQSNQVVLGIGMATIQAPGDGRPCIHVSSRAEGVRLSGLSLEASVISKFIYDGSTLLEWGDKGSIGAGNPNNPGVMHDLYCFVGGRSLDRTVKVQTMVKIYSSHVVGDNMWLWRADHVQLMDKEQPNRPELSEYHITTYGECQCDTGLEVFGDGVIFHGLAVEHTYKDMVIWHGKQGQVYFYQSELPYDVPGDKYKNVAGYRVESSATDHVAKGLGVYSYFRDYDDVVVESAIVHHAANGLYENAFTVWLNGYSGIKSVINEQGGVTAMPGKPVEVQSFKGTGIFTAFFWLGILKQMIR